MGKAIGCTPKKAIRIVHTCAITISISSIPKSNERSPPLFLVLLLSPSFPRQQMSYSVKLRKKTVYSLAVRCNCWDRSYAALCHIFLLITYFVTSLLSLLVDFAAVSVTMHDCCVYFPVLLYWNSLLDALENEACALISDETSATTKNGTKQHDDNDWSKWRLSCREADERFWLIVLP